ncbi:MAG: PLDc_N domain-containing protein [Acidobacteria bacterium]|nr:PLDc_N domain-containing protein [Acidobacteriota bacterium]
MARYLVFIVLLAVFIYGLIDCVRSDARDVRGIAKGWWVLIVIALPLVGVLLWFALGRPRYAEPQSAPSAGPLAPDDDPEFLANLERSRRRAAADAQRQAAKRQRDQQFKDKGTTS